MLEGTQTECVDSSDAPVPGANGNAEESPGRQRFQNAFAALITEG